MKPAYTKTACYQIHAVCLTPLRTAGADADTEAVLRDSHGRAMVQGSSIAGALREWIETHEPDSAIALFGSQTSQGALVISDGVFSSDADCTLRPRLRICKESGAADDGGKFDVMHVNTGSAFDFSLTCVGHEDVTKKTAVIERMLAALDCGDIALGAQKSNGFGRISLQVKRRLFDMTNVDDRKAWLEDRWNGTPIALPKVGTADYVCFTLHGAANSILVKSGQIESKDAGSYMPNIREGGKPVLPGSSVKGAVRARAEMIAVALGLDEDAVKQVFGTGGESVNYPGRILFEDVLLEDRKQRISRIRINKFTGGVMRGGLFTEEPISSKVALRVRVPANCPQGCCLILYALRDLALGLYNLGSGGSIGRGFIREPELSAETPDGRRLVLSFRTDGSAAVTGDSALAAEWRQSLEVRA